MIATMMLWLYFVGVPADLQWEERVPFWSLPSFLVSSITFSTIGAWLFKKGFYKELYNFIGNYQVFTWIKAIIWAILMAIVAGVIYVCLWITNTALNIWHNLPALMQMVLPSLLISFCIWLLIIYFMHPKNKRV